MNSIALVLLYLLFGFVYSLYIAYTDGKLRLCSKPYALAIFFWPVLLPAVLIERGLFTRSSGIYENMRRLGSDVKQ